MGIDYNNNKKKLPTHLHLTVYLEKLQNKMIGMTKWRLSSLGLLIFGVQVLDLFIYTCLNRECFVCVCALYADTNYVDMHSDVFSNQVPLTISNDRIMFSDDHSFSL